MNNSEIKYRIYINDFAITYDDQKDLITTLHDWCKNVVGGGCRLRIHICLSFSNNIIQIKLIWFI
jgi:hypothetical protein